MGRERVSTAYCANRSTTYISVHLSCVTQFAVARARLRIALCRLAVAAAARRAQEQLVAAGEDNLRARIRQRLAVDEHFAERARAAARKARRGKLEPLGDEEDRQRRRVPVLEEYFLAKATAELAGASGARAQALVVRDEGRVALDDL